MGIGYKIFKAASLPLQRLPLGFHYALGRVVEWVARDVLAYRRDVITVNFSRSFPEKQYKEIVAIRKDFYRHFGEIFAEAMWFGGCRRRPGRFYDQGIVKADPEGAKELSQAYLQSPSVMLMSSHFGNWELSGGLFESFEEALSFTHYDYYVVYKKVENEFWDEFFRDNRKAPIMPDYYNYVESHNVLRHAIENRGKKLVYNFITDQCPYKGAAGVDVGDFMGQPTLSMFAAASLARKLHMAVFEPCYVRQGRGKYLLKLVKICDDASGLSPEQIMKEYYRILEEEIRKDPGNYLWSHKRWKKRPLRPTGNE